MKIGENVSVDSYLRTCGRRDVKKLIVAMHFAIALSRPMDSNSSLQEIFSSFQFTKCLTVIVGHLVISF